MTNVLLITTDQHRADSLGSYGNPVCQTPNLDALAASGTRYTACRTQNQFCQPARATILTGQYPSTHGVTFNGIDLPDDAVEQSVATAFGRAGFDTAMFGKAHFATTYPFNPTGRIESVAGSAAVPGDWHGPYFGFDHVQLMLFGHNMRVAPLMGDWNWCFGPAPMGLHYGRWLYRDGIEAGNERLRRMSPESAGAAWGPTQTWRNAIDEEDHPTTWTADCAVDWLGRRSAGDDPFFAWVSFTDPHHPMDPPGRWFDMYSPDDVGEVLPPRRDGELDSKPPIQALWSQGARGRPFEWANPGGATLTEGELRSMIAGYYGMVSQLDHAVGRIMATLAERGLTDDTLVVFTTDHGEMLGDHKMIFKGPLPYEGLLRLPLIVSGPGVAPGGVVDDPVGTIDLAPTMLGAAGVDLPDHLEGSALDADGHDAVFTEVDFAALLPVRMRILTTRTHKLVRYPDSPGIGELYDLGEDPDEFENRWDDPACAAVKAELSEQLDPYDRPLARTLASTGLVA